MTFFCVKRNHCTWIWECGGIGGKTNGEFPLPGGPDWSAPWFCGNGLFAEWGLVRGKSPLGGLSPKGLVHESRPDDDVGGGAGGALGWVGRLRGLGGWGKGWAWALPAKMLCKFWLPIMGWGWCPWFMLAVCIRIMFCKCCCILCCCCWMACWTACN